mgnify:CR=1 FL=1
MAFDGHDTRQIPALIVYMIQSEYENVCFMVPKEYHNMCVS